MSTVTDFARSAKYLSMARQNLADKDKAEDAVQDTVVQALQHLPPDHDNPMGWLVLTLKRTCWAMNRRAYISMERNWDGTRPMHDFARPPDDLVQAKDQLRALGQALGTLKPAQRRALQLKSLGFSYQETAAIEGWTYTKVNRCISEGKRALADALAE